MVPIDQIETTATEYLTKAKFFNPPYGQNFKILNINTINETVTGKPVAYVVHLSPQGFIIFSAEEAISPILAYSNDSRFTGRITTKNIIRSDVQNWEKSLKENESEKLKNKNLWQGLQNKQKLNADQ